MLRMRIFTKLFHRFDLVALLYAGWWKTKSVVKSIPRRYPSFTKEIGQPIEVPKWKTNKSLLEKSANEDMARTKVSPEQVSIRKSISEGSDAFRRYGHDFALSSLKPEAAEPPITVIECRFFTIVFESNHSGLLQKKSSLWSVEGMQENSRSLSLCNTCQKTHVRCARRISNTSFYSC